MLNLNLAFRQFARFSLLPSHSFRLISASAPLMKDKPMNISKGEPRKSKFLKLDEDGNEIKPVKKERSEDDVKKLEAARKERELKKKEIRAKQIEIQKKRDAAKNKKTA